MILCENILAKFLITIAVLTFLATVNSNLSAAENYLQSKIVKMEALKQSLSDTLRLAGPLEKTKYWSDVEHLAEGSLSELDIAEERYEPAFDNVFGDGMVLRYKFMMLVFLAHEQQNREQSKGDQRTSKTIYRVSTNTSKNFRAEN